MDFLRKVIEATPACTDQEHVPIIIHSVPQIPDRSDSILRGGASPLSAMMEGIFCLERAGAHGIAIACNSAHYWYDEIRRNARSEIMHISDAVADQLDEIGTSHSKVGLIATDATIKAGIYDKRLRVRGYECITLSTCETDALVWPAIRSVKAGDIQSASVRLEQAVEKLLNSNVSKVILGCTEVPVGLSNSPQHILDNCLDATKALAISCVAWARDRAFE
ncbi:amino acid racemase [Mesorhizobium sp. M0217]